MQTLRNESSSRLLGSTCGRRQRRQWEGSGDSIVFKHLNTALNISIGKHTYVHKVMHVCVCACTNVHMLVYAWAQTKKILNKQTRRRCWNSATAYSDANRGGSSSRGGNSSTHIRQQVIAIQRKQRQTDDNATSRRAKPSQKMFVCK